MFGGKIGLAELVVLIGMFVLYFLPTIAARRRHHPNATAIALVNVLLGWTFVGWIVALIWTFTVPKKDGSGRDVRPVACWRCGKRQPENAAFCDSCGADMVSGAAK